MIPVVNPVTVVAAAALYLLITLTGVAPGPGPEKNQIQEEIIMTNINTEIQYALVHEEIFDLISDIESEFYNYDLDEVDTEFNCPLYINSEDELQQIIKQIEEYSELKMTDDEWDCIANPEPNPEFCFSIPFRYRYNDTKIFIKFYSHDVQKIYDEVF